MYKHEVGGMAAALALAVAAAPFCLSSLAVAMPLRVQSSTITFRSEIEHLAPLAVLSARFTTDDGQDLRELEVHQGCDWVSQVDEFVRAAGLGPEEARLAAEGVRRRVWVKEGQTLRNKVAILLSTRESPPQLTIPSQQQHVNLVKKDGANCDHGDDGAVICSLMDSLVAASLHVHDAHMVVVANGFRIGKRAREAMEMTLQRQGWKGLSLLELPEFEGPAGDAPTPFGEEEVPTVHEMLAQDIFVAYEQLQDSSDLAAETVAPMPKNRAAPSSGGSGSMSEHRGGQEERRAGGAVLNRACRLRTGATSNANGPALLVSALPPGGGPLPDTANTRGKGSGWKQNEDSRSKHGGGQGLLREEAPLPLLVFDRVTYDDLGELDEGFLLQGGIAEWMSRAGHWLTMSEDGSVIDRVRYQGGSGSREGWLGTGGWMGKRSVIHVHEKAWAHRYLKENRLRHVENLVGNSSGTGLGSQGWDRSGSFMSRGLVHMVKMDIDQFFLPLLLAVKGGEKPEGMRGLHGTFNEGKQDESQGDEAVVRAIYFHSRWMGWDPDPLLFECRERRLHMPVAAVVLVHDDVFLMPWTVEEVAQAVEHVMDVVVSQWATEEEQREFGSQLIREDPRGFKRVLVLDTDEFWHPVELSRYKDREIECLVEGGADTAGGTADRHQGLELDSSVAVCHHLSYVRTDEEVLRKTSSFAHASDVQAGWFERSWVGWATNHSLTDLHPTRPSAYKRVVSQPLVNLTPALRRLHLDSRKGREGRDPKRACLVEGEGWGGERGACPMGEGGRSWWSYGSHGDKNNASGGEGWSREGDTRGGCEGRHPAGWSNRQKILCLVPGSGMNQDFFLEDLLHGKGNNTGSPGLEVLSAKALDPARMERVQSISTHNGRDDVGPREAGHKEWWDAQGEAPQVTILRPSFGEVIQAGNVVLEFDILPAAKGAGVAYGRGSPHNICVQVNAGPCNMVDSKLLFLDGFFSGTYAIAVKLLGKGPDVCGSNPAEDRKRRSRADFAGKVQSSGLPVCGASTGEKGISKDTAMWPEKKKGVTAPLGSTSMLGSSPGHCDLEVLAVDWVLVDVVGPRWNSTVMPSGVKSTGTIRGDSRGNRWGPDGGGSMGSEEMVDSHFVEVMNVATLSSPHDADDRVGKDGLGDRMETGAGMKVEEGVGEGMGMIHLAIVSNNLESHSQNRVFTKLCEGLPRERYRVEWFTAGVAEQQVEAVGSTTGKRKATKKEGKGSDLVWRLVNSLVPLHHVAVPTDRYSAMQTLREMREGQPLHALDTAMREKCLCKERDEEKAGPGCTGYSGGIPLEQYVETLARFDLVLTANSLDDVPTKVLMEGARMAKRPVRVVELCNNDPPSDLYAEAFIAPSHYAAHCNKAAQGIPTGIIYPTGLSSADWVPHGVDPKPIERKGIRVAFVGRLSFERSPGLFLHTARALLDILSQTQPLSSGAGSHKGPIVDEEAGQEAGARKERFLRIHFLVVGSGPLSAFLEALTLELGLERYVEFCGSIAEGDMPAFLRTLDLVINPIICQTFGISNVEAAVSGVPVVGFSSCGNTESIGDAGVLVDSPSHLALAEAAAGIIRSITHEGYEELMKGRYSAMERTMEEHGLLRLITRHDAFLSSLVKRRRRLLAAAARGVGDGVMEHPVKEHHESIWFTQSADAHRSGRICTLVVMFSPGSAHLDGFLKAVFSAVFPWANVDVVADPGHQSQQEQQDYDASLYVVSALDGGCGSSWDTQCQQRLADIVRLHSKSLIVFVSGEAWDISELRPDQAALALVATTNPGKIPTGVPTLHLPNLVTSFGERRTHSPADLLRGMDDPDLDTQPLSISGHTDCAGPRTGARTNPVCDVGGGVIYPSQRKSKRSVAYMYARCDRHHRERFFDLLVERGVQVDALGACRGIRSPDDPKKRLGRMSATWHDDAVQVYKYYHLVIAFENSADAGYITEKIANAFLAGAIPVYWGTVEVLDLFNPQSFIHCGTFPTMEDCADRVAQVAGNEALIEEYRATRWVQEGGELERWFSWYPGVGGEGGLTASLEELLRRAAQERWQRSSSLVLKE